VSLELDQGRKPIEGIVWERRGSQTHFVESRGSFEEPSHNLQAREGEKRPQGDFLQTSYLRRRVVGSLGSKHDGLEWVEYPLLTSWDWRGRCSSWRAI